MILGLDREDADCLAIAIEKALLNSVQHGNLEVSSELRNGDGSAFDDLIEKRRRESPYRERRVHIWVKCCQQEAVFVIRDEGTGFSVAQLPDPRDPTNLERLGGRGILLMRTFMDEVQYNETGNEVRLVKRRPAQP